MNFFCHFLVWQGTCCLAVFPKYLNTLGSCCAQKSHSLDAQWIVRSKKAFLSGAETKNNSSLTMNFYYALLCDRNGKIFVVFWYEWIHNHLFHLWTLLILLKGLKPSRCQGNPYRWLVAQVGNTDKREGTEDWGRERQIRKLREEKIQREREASGSLLSSFRGACDHSHHTLHTKFAPYALVAVQSNSGKDLCVLSSEGKWWWLS